MKISFAFSILLASAAALSAAVLEWEPKSNMDGQLFPSLIIATATMPSSIADGEEPNPDLLGDPDGLLGIEITAPTDNAKVKVTVRENGVLAESTWSGLLPEAGHQYYIAPKVNFKFDQLRKARQQVPMNVSFLLEVNGKSAGEKIETITVRSINDCPFGVRSSEETIADDDEDADTDKEASSDSDTEETENTSEESDGEYTDMGWMFAAYVNEGSPIVDKILKEALATGVVNAFAGYQRAPDDVLREVFAIWVALQKRGIHYSNITTTPGDSPTVYSQHVRFMDESLENEQANCVDGSVLFSSILRKLGLRSFLVTVPGHMFMGLYLTEDGDERVAIETTMLGSRTEENEQKTRVIKPLSGLRDRLEKKVQESSEWKTFAGAVAVGTENLVENQAKFEADDEPTYQITEIDTARKDGVMPISYEKN